MASLNEHGHEILDQTPVDIPFKVSRPEPIHLRLRRIAEQIYAERTAAGEQLETLEEANDFDVPEEDAIFSTPYEEPDYMPSVPETQGVNGPYTPEEVAYAREMILQKRQEAALKSDDAGGTGAVSSAPAAPAEPAS